MSAGGTKDAMVAWIKACESDFNTICVVIHGDENPSPHGSGPWQERLRGLRGKPEAVQTKPALLAVYEE